MSCPPLLGYIAYAGRPLPRLLGPEFKVHRMRCACCLTISVRIS
jgi:hypothetical protein